MTEPAEALRTLVDSPASPPEPLTELRRRVDACRRRRTRRRAVLGGLGAVAVAVAIVPLVDRASDQTTRVVAGPEPTLAPAPASVSTPPTTHALEFVPGEQISYRLDYELPPGWQTHYTLRDHLLVGTRPLSEVDRTLALLARNDAAFTAFPVDGVVVVVGNDPVEAKYLMAPDGSMVGPGPAYALGPEKALPGGVRVRRGDIPQSGVKIASYAGPAAPAARVVEAEAIAAGIRLVRTGDPSVRPPAPPDGSRPGLPGGTLSVPEQGLPEVARTEAGGSTLVLVAGRDCAYVRWVDAEPSLPGYESMAGACGTRPGATTIETFGPPISLRRPGAADSTAVIFRAGPGVTRLSARLADGRTVPAVMGADGWGLVASEGRVVAVGGLDTLGRTIAETFVG